MNYARSFFTLVFLFSCFTLSGMRVDVDAGIQAVTAVWDGAEEIDLLPKLIRSKEFVFMPGNQRLFGVGRYQSLKKAFLVEPSASGFGVTVKMKKDGSTEWEEQIIKSDCTTVCVSCHPKYPLLFFCEKEDEICVWDLGKQECLYLIQCESEIQNFCIKDSGQMLIKCAETHYNYYDINALVEGCNKRVTDGSVVEAAGADKTEA